MKNWMRRELAKAPAVLRTDFPSCYSTISRKQIVASLPLPRQVIERRLRLDVPVNSSSVSLQEEEGGAKANQCAVAPMLSKHGSSVWFLSPSPSEAIQFARARAEAHGEGWGVVTGAPLSVAAAEGVLRSILFEVERACPGVEVGSFVDDIVVLLPSHAAIEPVEQAFKDASQDAIRPDAHAELLRRVVVHDPKLGFPYVGYLIRHDEEGVSFESDPGYWEAFVNKIFSASIHDPESVDPESVLRAMHARAQRYSGDARTYEALGRAMLQVGAACSDRVLDLPRPEVLSQQGGGRRRIINVDGSCSGSPGIGAWAFTVEGNADGAADMGYGVDPLTDNNKMELLAAVRALESLVEPSSACVISDSRFLVTNVQENLDRWRRRDWRVASGKRVAYKSLWQRLDAQLRKHDVIFEWVKGHSDHLGNRRVDTLAKRVLRRHLEGHADLLGSRGRRKARKLAFPAW